MMTVLTLWISIHYEIKIEGAFILIIADLLTVYWVCNAAIKIFS